LGSTGDINTYEIAHWKQADCQSALNFWQVSNASEGQNWCEYGLGRLMAEYLLVKSNSLDKFLDVYEAAGSGLNFSEAFEKTYQMSLSDFFKEVSIYLGELGWDK
jgi:hypothetical protein